MTSKGLIWIVAGILFLCLCIAPVMGSCTFIADDYSPDLGNTIHFSGTCDAGETDVYMVMVGPNLGINGANMNTLDMPNNPAQNGNASTFLSAPVSGGAWSVDWSMQGRVLDPGTYTVYGQTSPDIPPGSFATMSFVMTRAPGTGEIEVYTTPGGADVSIDSVPTGFTTTCRIHQVTPGSHTVDVAKSGYYPTSSSYVIVAGSTTNANFNLIQIPGVAVTFAGGGTFYLGEKARFYVNVTPGNAQVPYMFVTGPNLPANGAVLDSNTLSPVVNGDPASFTRPVIILDTFDFTLSRYEWQLLEGGPLDAGNYTIYGETQPYDKDNVDTGGNLYGTVSIIIKKPFITGMFSSSHYPPGSPFAISGTREGSQTPVNFTCTNKTAGPGGLPPGGVKPDDFSVTSISGDSSTFGSTTVQPDRSYSYSFFLGGSPTGANLLPGSYYRCIAESTPVTITDAMNTVYPDNMYTKLQVLVDGIHADYAVDRDSGSSPLTVAFTDVSVSSINPINTGLSTINFDDGSSASFTGTVSHTYTATHGTFHPTVTVCDTLGNCNTDTNATITILAGNIAVDSYPQGAEIYIDGEDKGQVTPFTFSDQSTGYHQVKVTMATYYTQETSVYVENGVTTPVFFTLAKEDVSLPGTIVVESNVENAKIFIDGIDTNQLTNHTFVNTYLGSHTVKITYDGYLDAQRQVDIPSETTVTTVIIMDPVPAYTPEVVKDIKQVLREELNNDASLKTAASSNVQAEAGTPLTLWGPQPAIITPAKKSTVVFIDDLPGAQWEHPARYVFIDEDGKKTVKNVMSPSPDIAVDQIAGASQPAGKNLNNIGSGSTPSNGGGLGFLNLQPVATVQDSGKRYAILIDGGYNTTSNHIRYWNDISFMYQTLNQSYGYPKENIRVYMSDGLDTHADRHSKTNADNTEVYDNSPVRFDLGSSDEVTGDARYATIVSALNGIQNYPNINQADLLIFTTGHGGWDPAANNNQGDAYLYLWNEPVSSQDRIYATDFANRIKFSDPVKNPKSITLVMEQCNSGGFATDKSGLPSAFMKPENIPLAQKRMIATASAWNEPSNDNGFSSTWTMVAAKINSNMLPAALADTLTPQDGMISIFEASDYAVKNDPYKLVEHSVYQSTPATAGADGQSQFLSYITQVAPGLRLTSPSGSDNWYMGTTRTIKWGAMGLTGQTLTIDLLKNGIKQGASLKTSVNPADGTASWAIPPTTYAAGTDYAIRITSSGTPSISSQKSLTLTKGTNTNPGTYKITANFAPPQPPSPVPTISVKIDDVAKAALTAGTQKQYIGNVPGTHTIKLTAPGFNDYETMVDVSNGATKTVPTIVLQHTGQNGAGEMVVTSNAPAEVVINDVPTGLNTEYKVMMDPGWYKVSVQNPNYGTITPVYQTVYVQIGQTATADFELTDHVANQPPEVGTISVPMDPVKANTEITVTSTVTDPNPDDMLTALWGWDDDKLNLPATSQGDIVRNDDGTFSITGRHTYKEPGVYTVNLTVTDIGGLNAKRDATTFVIIYDPSAGFVLGAGDFKDQTTGKGFFGFESKYRKGQTVPLGITEFYYEPTKMNFFSYKYDWLVVSGAKATYKGIGKIHGRPGDYTFIVSTIDGAQLPRSNPDRSDKFRIKINNTASVVYDTQPGAADDADPTTKILHGFVMVRS